MSLIGDILKRHKDLTNILIADSLLRGIYKTYGRKFGTAIKVNDEQMFQACLFRTTENNPVNHNTDHIARLYTIPKNIQQQLFQYGGLPRLFMKQVTTFQECAILIRQPAIEVISYLSQTDYTKPVNKYVLCILLKLFEFEYELILKLFVLYCKIVKSLCFF